MNVESRGQVVDSLVDMLGDFALTPGAMLLKIQWSDSPIWRPHYLRRSAVYAANNLPEEIAVPPEACGCRVTLFGALKPSRPIHGCGEIIQELAARRFAEDLPAFPYKVSPEALGFDDVGFLTYEVWTWQELPCAARLIAAVA